MTPDVTPSGIAPSTTTDISPSGTVVPPSAGITPSGTQHMPSSTDVSPSATDDMSSTEVLSTKNLAQNSFSVSLQLHESLYKPPCTINAARTDCQIR